MNAIQEILLIMISPVLGYIIGLIIIGFTETISEFIRETREIKKEKKNATIPIQRKRNKRSTAQI